VESIKGGRGKKAPYKTTHCRIPDPIKSAVDLLAASYREFVVTGKDPQELLELIEAAIAQSSQAKKISNKEKVLQEKLQKMTADRDKLLIRLSEAENRHLQEIKKIYDEANKKNESLENYNREIDRANGYLEKENRRLRDKLSEPLGSTQGRI
jgi:rubrerythrin